MISRFVAFAAAALWLGATPSSVVAQPAASAASPAPTPTPVNLPTPGPRATLDPYAREAIDVLGGAVRRGIEGLANSTTGQVTYFKHYDLQLQTGTNSYRSVRLHQGTIINPRGATIAIGERVDVSGNAGSDGYLEANAITIER